MARGGEALLVRGGTIVAIGPLASVRALARRGTARVDLGGGTLLPGFTDAHLHLITWIRALQEPWLQSQDVASIERAVRERVAARPGAEWLKARGWVPRDWGADRRSRATLDRIAPERPLVLHAVDGHSVWANRVALELAGIGARTPDPPGGRVERDSLGEPTGALIEEAAKLLRPFITQDSTPREDLARAIGRARSLGLTSAHDFDRALTWRPAQELEREGRLGFRLLLTIPIDALDAAAELGLEAGFGGARLRIGPVKIFADGTLGSATALLEEPYEDRADRGVEVVGPAELAHACVRAARAGLTVAIHAIGDCAVRNALDAIEAAGREGLAFALPPRVEHVQLARTEDFPRFRALGAIASVQPVHLLTDRDVARQFWGDRCERSYPWKSLLRSGARLMFGSDAPFDRAGPLRALQAAVLRGDGADARPFHPEQRLTLAQALQAHLEEPHRAAGWARLGRLSPGWGADLVHFDQNLLESPPDEWHRGQVLGTWIEGARVHGRALPGER